MFSELIYFLPSSQSEVKVNVLPLGTASIETGPGIERKWEAKQDGYALFFNLKSIINRALLRTQLFRAAVRRRRGAASLCWKVPRLHPFVLLIRLL
jgi:hypothetical protein